MAMRLVLSTVLLVIFLLPLAGAGDEGMWPLYDLDKLPWEELQARGLELSREDIYDPDRPDISDACINLGGGSASFVSPNGLIITNHHVAFGALQKASTVEQNYIRDGFYAARYEDEIPAVGYNVYVTLSIDDVTDRILQAVPPQLNELARYNALDSITKVIVAESEKGTDIVAEVQSMFGGTQYVRYIYLKLSDVRIVHAPPASIGDFGGEIDNWMWPRHTGDYSFLRAYVARNGSAAEYSKDNVPYQPKSFLAISSKGVQEGDLSILVGYPGSTRRYAVSYEIDEIVNFAYPRSVKRMQDALAIIDEVGSADPEVALRLAGTAKNLNNYLKKTIGMLDGFLRDSVLVRKQEEERAFVSFLGAEADRWERFGWILPAFDSLYSQRAALREKREVLGLIRYVDYLSLAQQIHKWAKQRELPDMERERGYQDRDSLKFVRRIEQAQINLVPLADRVFAAYFVRQALALPADQRLAAIDSLYAHMPADKREAFMANLLDSMYAGSVIGSREKRLAMIRMSLEELSELNDPFLCLAASLSPEQEAIQLEEKVFDGAVGRLRAEFAKAIFAWKEGSLYPDANGTKRINFGNVQGFRPRDAISYNHQTFLTGVMEKESGVDPFIVPSDLKQAWATRNFGSYVDSRSGDIPIDFLTTNDGTNGNSGSPVLNGRGEVIGLDFDTNLESVVKDYYFNGDISRAIAVDIRYVLFLIERVYGYRGLLKELTIQ